MEMMKRGMLVRALTLAAALLCAALLCAARGERVETRFSREGLMLPFERVALKKAHETPMPGHARAQPAPERDLTDLPEVFDWSNVGGTNYLTANWNQHIPTYCGSCYVHGSLSAVQDRIKISKNAKVPDVMLSRQALLNCIADGVGKNAGGGSDGCYGGSTQEVYEFLHKIGLPDETCNHYVARATRKCNAEAMCMNCMAYANPVMDNFRCWPVKNFTRYRVTEYGKLPKRQEAIMSEILTNGPVACSLATFDDFDFNYTGGVWTKDSGANESNHVVEVTGWGKTASGVPFWVARNSWGSYWGESGFFKLERGRNLMLVEEDCWFMKVDWSGELEVSDGDFVGGMYGLRAKPAAAAEDDRAFRLALALQAVDATAEAVKEHPSPLVFHPDPHMHSRTHLMFIASLAIAFLLGIVVCAVLVACVLLLRRRNEYRPIA